MSPCLAGKLYGKIQWRIVKDNGDFLERNTVQTFKQQVRDATLVSAGITAYTDTSSWCLAI